MKLDDKRELQIWNEAVKKVCREISKWDGVIPDEETRKFMANAILKIYLRKKISPNS
jgi:hypothetical protein